jgi:hypothetical protein
VFRAEAGWDDPVALLAALVEQLDALTRLTYSAASGKSAPWDPIRIPRPGSSPDAPSSRPRRAPTPDEMRELMGG